MALEKTRREAELEKELSITKAQLRATPDAKKALPVKWTTSDPELAAKYNTVGGRIVTITKLYPKLLHKAGKKYGFADTQVELDALVKQAEAVT